MKTMPLITLTELRDAHPALFYAQDWFRGEAFTRAVPVDPFLQPPPRLIRPGEVPTSSKGLPQAVDLAAAYVRDPEHPCWRGYLWCRDTDHLGQRVFVGGTANGRGLEIHRHLHITENWSTPAW